MRRDVPQARSLLRRDSSRRLGVSKQGHSSTRVSRRQAKSLRHKSAENLGMRDPLIRHARVPAAAAAPPSRGKMAVRYLDTTRLGPMFLREAEVARLVLTSLKRGVELGHYELRAYSIMANHVHVLLLPKVLPSRFLQSLKGSTAREVNRHLNRTGEPFWQAESYDHWVRDTAELERIAAYIESNPVKAGLVSKPEDYRWSSAWRGAEARFAEIPCVGAAGVDTSVDAAGMSACAAEQH